MSQSSNISTFNSSYTDGLIQESENAQLLAFYTDTFDTLSAELKENIVEQSYRQMGAGSYYMQYLHNYAKIDRFNVKHILPNTEYSGLTFITRPKLNLSTPSLRSHRFLNILDTLDPYSTQFMVRSLLDTYSSKWNSNWRIAISESPLLDWRSPFLTPLTNNLISISGFPTHSVETATSEGGYYGEDYSLVVGSNDYKKSFDLQLSFVEPQGGLLNYLFHTWLLVQTLECTGEVIPYMTDINRRLLNYSVSIYRFLLDPSRRYITRASKCTGCFPVSRPSGAAFDFNINDRYVAAARDISITFKCNHFMEDDPIIFRCFNTLVSRYWTSLKSLGPTGTTNGTIKKCDPTASHNYMGIPYVITNNGRNPPELGFYYTDDDDLIYDNKSIIKAQAEQLSAIKKQMQKIQTTSSPGRIYI